MSTATFTVTREWIEEFKTARGGWTQPQLEAIGVPWPPVHGWKVRIEGKVITFEARAMFEARLRVRDVRRGGLLPL